MLLRDHTYVENMVVKNGTLCPIVNLSCRFHAYVENMVVIKFYSLSYSTFAAQDFMHMSKIWLLKMVLYIL